MWENKFQRHFLAARIRIYEGEQPSLNPETGEMEWQNLLWDTGYETPCLVWSGARSDKTYTVRATTPAIDISQAKKGCGPVNLHLHQPTSPEEPPEEKSPPAIDPGLPPLEPGPEPELLPPEDIPEDIPEPAPRINLIFSGVMILAGVLMSMMGYVKKS